MDYDPASLPGMEDEITADHESASHFEEEKLSERTLEVPLTPQALYQHENVPTKELLTVNELWQWMFGRDAEPDKNPAPNALNVIIKL